MNTGRFICVLVICLVLLLDPFRTTGGSTGVQAIAVDKKKIMKALFLAKLALKKKKLLVMPMPVPILVEKKHKEHHHMTFDHHGGW